MVGFLLDVLLSYSINCDLPQCHEIDDDDFREKRDIFLTFLQES